MRDDVKLSEALERLRRQHHALYPVYLISPPPGEALASEKAQEWIAKNILFDPVLKGKQPNADYERAFWRKVISHLENGVEVLHERGEDVEVDSQFYERLTESMVSASSGSDLPGQTYRSFIYDEPAWLEQLHSGSQGVSEQGLDLTKTKGTAEQCITLIEEQMAIQGGTTGLRTWTAALHLGHHILFDPHILQPSVVQQTDHTSSSQRVPSPFGTSKLPEIVELGAGTGFLSILLAKLLTSVISTDLGSAADTELASPDSDDNWNSEGDNNVSMGFCGNLVIRQTPLSRLRENVKLNDQTGNVEVKHLDWMDVNKPDTEKPRIWHTLRDMEEAMTIIAADVIYDPDLVPPLVKTMHYLLQSSSADERIALIAATVRNENTLNLFQQTCRSEGMTIQELELKPMDAAGPTFWDSGLDRQPHVRIMRITAGA